MEHKYRLDRLKQRDWIFNSPLRPVCYAYEDYLRDLKYKENTIDIYLKSLIHFAHWLKVRRKELQDIDKGTGDAFVGKHLLRCSCRAPVFRSEKSIRAALVLLDQVLLQQGVVERRDGPIKPADSELERYDAYLKITRGLALNTRRDRKKIIANFWSAVLTMGIMIFRIYQFTKSTILFLSMPNTGNLRHWAESVAA